MLRLAGDPNIGLYARATDKFCLVARNIRDKDEAELKEVLDVPLIKLGLYGTELVGVFCVANSSAVLIPDIIYKSERAHLEKELKKLRVKLHIIKTEHTALGNNMLLNDKAGIISSELSREDAAQVKKAFPKVEFVQMSLADSLPGSVGAVTNNGGVFSHNLSDKEISSVEKLFGFEIGLGTANLGSPFIASGVIANSKGFAVGANSSGYEVGRIDESLGFLK